MMELRCYKTRSTCAIFHLFLGLTILHPSSGVCNDAEASIYSYPIPVGIEDLEDASNPLPQFIPTNLVFSIHSQYVDRTLSSVLADSESQVLRAGANMVRSLVQNNTADFFEISGFDGTRTPPLGSDRKEAFFSMLRDPFQQESLATTMIKRRMWAGDLSFLFVHPTQSNQDRMLCFPIREATPDFMLDFEIFGRSPLAQAISRLAIEYGKERPGFEGAAGLPVGRDHEIVIVNPFGDTSSAVTTTLAFNGGVPKSNATIHDGEMFVPMEETENSDGFGSVIRFYHETWKLMSEIPEVPNFQESEELEMFLAQFAPRSAEKLRQTITSLGSDEKNLATFKKTNIFNRRIRFIIDAHPVKILFYQMTDKEEYRRVMYDMVLWVDNDHFLIINHRSQSVIDFLIKWDRFESELLGIINGS